MRFSRFKATSGDQWALVSDVDKLPALVMGHWTFEREIEVAPGSQLVGHGADEIIAAIEDEGFFLWPDLAGKHH